MCIGFDQIKEECKRKGHAEGQAEGRAIGCFETMLSSVRALIQNMELEADDAMSALNIPDEIRETIRQKLNTTE